MTALILLKDFLETQIELWRPIAEAPDYDVSNLGRVRGYLRQVSRGGRTGFITMRTETPRLLTPNHGKGGDYYAHLTLSTPEGQKNFRVHILVADAFLPKIDGLDEINHKNAIKKDNRLPNLERSDHDHNHEHATVNGLRQSGEKHWNAKLTEEIIRGMRAEYAAGKRQVDIAIQFNVDKACIWRIVHRKIWKYVE